MQSLATNKQGRAPQQAALRLSQVDLHAKILHLVGNRMQPASSTLLLHKQACNSCVTASPAGNTKRNSLATTRVKERQSRVNQTVCDNGTGGSPPGGNKEYPPHPPPAPVLVKNKSGVTSSGNLTKQFLLKHARKMCIESKVVCVSIDHAKVGDFTIDLRGQMPTEFVNVKMLNKLKLENAQKERRIGQLESEVMQLHERIIDMSLVLEQRSKESLEIVIPSYSSINKISEGGQKGQRERQGSSVASSENGNMDRDRKIDLGEESLLRMLKIQANQIEKCHTLMHSLPPRQRQKRYSFQ